MSSFVDDFAGCIAIVEHVDDLLQGSPKLWEDHLKRFHFAALDPTTWRTSSNAVVRDRLIEQGEPADCWGAVWPW